MDIPVLIEPVDGNGYCIRGGEPFALTAEGATPEAALAQFKNCISAKLRDGARVALVAIEVSEHPWLQFAGMYQENDPLIKEWLETIEAQRDQPEAS